MKSKGNAPTAAQKRWREAVRDLGSIISGGPAVIHHAVGATGKHNKVDIGHWWLIPLTNEEHLALHGGETFGCDSRKHFEKQAYLDTHEAVRKYWLRTEAISSSDMPSMIENDAIMDYHR